MQLKIKKLYRDAVLPKYLTPGAACFDLHAVCINGFTKAEHDVLQRAGKNISTAYIEPGTSRVFTTGLTVEVPQGHVMLVFSRSGHGFKSDIRLANCVGVVDSDYRGAVQVKLTNDGEEVFQVESGDRIAQAMILPIPAVSFVEVDELSDTERGTGGLGSTGG